jgi:hypothetical protein
MAMTNYLSNALANAVVRNTSYTSPTSVYCALYSTAPTASTSGTELSGSGYSRQVVTFNAPSAGVATSNIAVTFGNATANWSPVVAVGIVNASTSGNLLYFNTVSTQNVLSGQSLTIGSGNITVTMS